MPRALRAVRLALAALVALFCATALTGCPPSPTSPLITADKISRSSFFAICGGLGEACCRAPAASQVPELGPLVACNVGLGCDIQTNKCVSPCGGTGQVCCDGPETRAPKWTADGRPYSPNTWDMQEMCKAGACERQSHRCFNCGTVDGQPCCPPDAAQATARCIGERLSCKFDETTFATRGTCIKCGIRGRPPCDWGCDPGLDLLKGMCEICGGDGQVPCDPPKGCKSGLGKIGGLCRICGGVNQIPCDNNACNPGLGVLKGLCVACGGFGQGPCDKGCNPGLRSINGVCTPCGGLNQPPCTTYACNYPYRVAPDGKCKPCGGLKQEPCDVGCDGNLVIINNQCSTPPTSEAPTCAQLGEGCVADFVAGKHCCKAPNTSTPLICIPPTCKACIPRGQQCTKNQTCCTYGDVCRLDVETNKETCGLGG